MQASSLDTSFHCRYLGSEDSSGMSVIEVRMASGWMPDQASLLQLKTSSKLKLKKYEMDKRNPDIVVFYFDEVWILMGILIQNLKPHKASKCC